MTFSVAPSVGRSTTFRSRIRTFIAWQIAVLAQKNELFASQISVVLNCLQDVVSVKTPVCMRVEERIDSVESKTNACEGTMKRGYLKQLAVAALLAFGATGTAAAGVIISPVSATINLGGPGFGSITNTLNQAGLSANFTSGVTDFDSYLATNPTHTISFGCCEWFSNSGTTSAQVTYNFGSVVTIDRLALWNEESSGIGLLVLDAPGNLGFLAANPNDNLLGPPYGAQVFTFAPITAQFVTFNMSQCPQPLPGSFPACAIGEVAFRVVPEPSALALLAITLLSLFGIGVMRRRADA